MVVVKLWGKEPCNSLVHLEDVDKDATKIGKDYPPGNSDISRWVLLKLIFRLSPRWDKCWFLEDTPFWNLFFWVAYFTEMCHTQELVLLLRRPLYFFSSRTGQHATPAQLQQYYLRCPATSKPLAVLHLLDRVFRGRLKSIPWNLRDLKGRGFPTPNSASRNMYFKMRAKIVNMWRLQRVLLKIEGNVVVMWGCLKIRIATENPVEMIHFKVESFEDT